MPRQSIMVFAHAMEAKLRRDDATKKPWETLDVKLLWYRAIEEMTELMWAIRKYDTGPDEWHAREIRQEAADAANFCMMIYSLMHPDLNWLVRGRESELSAFVHGGDVMPGL